MEYGAAAAVARWTRGGKDVRYLLVTRGEAGISSLDPATAGPLREAEQRASCAVVGVDDLTFLGREDGLVVADLDLRRDLAAAIRVHRPEVILSINHRDSWGGPSWNHVDHRETGRALLDAIRDAANPWVFAGVGGEAWGGVRFAAFSGSPMATHAVDVTDTVDVGIESLRCHEVYLSNLDGAGEDPTAFLRVNAEAAGPEIGAAAAATFELVHV